MVADSLLYLLQLLAVVAQAFQCQLLLYQLLYQLLSTLQLLLLQ